MPVAFTNSSSNVTVTNVTNGIAPSCVTVTTLSPTLTKSFSPTTFLSGGTTTLTFTVTNPAANPALTNVGFVDSLPSGLQIAATPAVGGTCTNAVAATTAAAGGTLITVSNLQVPAGASSCTVTVAITNKPGQVNPDCAGVPAAFTNGAGNVTVTNVTNGVSTSCVTVTTLTPTRTKSFSPTTFQSGGTTTLTFTVTNPAGNPALTNVGFVDSLPSGLQIAAPPAVGGTCTNAVAATTAAAGGTAITVANLQVPAGASSCTVTVSITNKPGQVNPSCTSLPVAFTNGPGNVTVTNVTNGVSNSCVTVTTLTPTLTKSFSPTTFSAGGTTTLTFTVTNPAGNPALTNVGFVDSLPSGLLIASPPAVGGTCTNAVAATTAAAGGTLITVTNLAVPAGASTCTVTVSITNQPGQTNPSCATSPAAFTNGAGNVTVTNVTNGVSNSCVIVTPLTPTLTKSFSPTTFQSGGTTTLTFTVSNPAGNSALTNVGFVDVLPSGLQIASPPSVGGTCVNAVAATTAAAGGTVVTVSNLQVPVGASSCTVSVSITNQAGQSNASCDSLPVAFTNAAANVTVTNVNNGISSSCVIVTTVIPPPAVASPIPTTSTEVLVALMLLLAGMGVYYSRRRS